MYILNLLAVSLSYCIPCPLHPHTGVCTVYNVHVKHIFSFVILRGNPMGSQFQLGYRSLLHLCLLDSHWLLTTVCRFPIVRVPAEPVRGQIFCAKLPAAPLFARFPLVADFCVQVSYWARTC
jgi:hypothetical protein